MADLSYDIPTELITVELPDDTVTLQETWDQTATFISSFSAMTTDNFMFGGGKDDLGGGLLTAITLTLVDWRMRFAARGGPSFEPTEINGGNLVGNVGSLGGASQDPVDPADFTFIKLARSTDASLLETGVSGLTQEESDQLDQIDTTTQSMDTTLTTLRKLMQNRMETDPGTGVMTIYDDDDTTPLLTANIYEDVAASQLYQGRGIERRNRLA